MRICILTMLFGIFASSTFASPFFTRALPNGPDPAQEWVITDMVAGDIGSDGINELVVAWRDEETGSNGFAVTYRWYAGKFQEVASISLSDRSWVYLEDTDSDGELELIIVEGGGDPGSLVTIHEWSEENWAPYWSHTFYSIRRADALGVGDVDGDSWNEIAVAIDWYDRQMAIIDFDYSTSSYSIDYTFGANDFRSASVADVNNDGQLDIVAGCGNWSYYDGRVYTWDGAGYSLVWDSPDLGNVSAAVADHNGDGIADVILANRASSHVNGQNGLHVYGWSSGTFQFQYLLSQNIPLVKPKALDFDNDGVEDLAAIAVGSDEPNSYFGDGLHFYQRVDGRFEDYEVMEGIIGRTAASIDGCDLDNDGFNEMVLGYADVVSGATGFWIQHVMDFPIITGINDIPMDDGRQVRITWSRAVDDSDVSPTYVKEYCIWRQVREGLKSAGAEILTTANGDLFELVGTTPAMQWDEYALVVPTLADEGEVTDPLFDFIVTAHLSDGPTYYTSPVQQGISIDQTAPPAPENLIGKFVPYNITLNWDNVPAADLSHYSVYRIGVSGEELIGSTASVKFIDQTPGMDIAELVYLVSASDWAGNEGPKTEIRSSEMSGTPDDLIPQLSASLSAYPNPFNPKTTVRFAVPVSGSVQVGVYDLAGRQVRVLANNIYPAGSFDVTWNGQDSHGRIMGAGTYILRMTTGKYEKNCLVSFVK
ncbi:MAG: VCBS repeat-containing protein [Gemmatimonadales bacterium]|nr:VCBS repeat-containing protein [Gemmatimonadales bacterium]